jgi:hypothetical protein
MNAAPGPWLAAAALLATALVAPGQDYTLEPIGFVSLAGASTDGTFRVTGSLGASLAGPMIAGPYSVTGELRTLLDARFLPSTALVFNGGFEEPSGGILPDATGMLSLWPPPPDENLLPHGDAEGLAGSDGTGKVPIPGWKIVGDLTVTRWNTPGGWPVSSDPGPPDRGLNFFSGGPEDGSSTATTRVALTADPARLEAGGFGVELSGWFGGWGTQGDTALLSARFLDAAGTDLGFLRIGGVTAAQRGSRTALVHDSASRNVPPGTREVEVVLEMRREVQSGWNDGYADSLGLALRSPSPETVPGWGVIGSDIAWVSNGNALGLRSPFGSRFLDLTGSRDRPPYGGITQTLGTIPNREYVLAFALGTHQDQPAHRGPVTVRVLVDSASHAFTFTPTGTGNQWQTFSLPFTATASATRLALVGTASGGGAYLGLDEVSVVPAGGSAPVPPILSIQTHPGDANLVVIAFTSEPGRRYVVETSEDVASGPWTSLAGTERLGTGGILSMPLPLAPDAEARFLRLRVGP